MTGGERTTVPGARDGEASGSTVVLNITAGTGWPAAGSVLSLLRHRLAPVLRLTWLLLCLPPAPAVSTDPVYNNLNASDVSATNTDNDVAGITVNPTAGLTTTEAGGTATFTVVLASQPTANVTVTFVSPPTQNHLLIAISSNRAPSTPTTPSGYEYPGLRTPSPLDQASSGTGSAVSSGGITEVAVGSAANGINVGGADRNWAALGGTCERT